MPQRLRSKLNVAMAAALKNGPAAGEALLEGVLLGAQIADDIITDMAKTEEDRC